MTITSIGHYQPAVGALTDMALAMRRNAQADSSATSPSFSDALNQIDQSSPAAGTTTQKTASALRKLEGLLMQQVIGTMLPDGKSGANWGKGLAGDVWRSMMSEQLASAMTRDGRLPILGNISEVAAGLSRAGKVGGS
jgi:hypothetical protein